MLHPFSGESSGAVCDVQAGVHAAAASKSVYRRAGSFGQFSMICFKLVMHIANARVEHRFSGAEKHRVEHRFSGASKRALQEAALAAAVTYPTEQIGFAGQ